MLRGLRKRLVCRTAVANPKLGILESRAGDGGAFFKNAKLTSNKGALLPA
jgi:hypothetical protein